MIDIEVRCKCGGRLLRVKQSKKHSFPIERTRKCLECGSEIVTLEIKASDWKMSQTLYEISNLVKIIKENLKMKTVKTVRIHAETDKLQFAVWIPDESLDDGEYIPFEKLNDAEVAEMAPRLGLTPLGVAAIRMLVEDIKETVGVDLVSIWQRLDAAGIK